MGLLGGNSYGIQTMPIEDSTLTETSENDYDEVLKHQKRYTKLLTMYINTTRINLYAKIIFKIVFFIITPLYNFINELPVAGSAVSRL